MANIVIHPGYPKAASSWLQDHIWGRSDLGLCAPWSERGPWGAPATIAESSFIRVDHADFDAAAARQRFRPGLVWAESRGLIPVLSSEILIDRPNGLGGWTGPVAHRLADTFDKARVVLIVREQQDAIRSSYRHHVETGGRESVVRFIGGGGALVPLRIAHLSYDTVVATYDAHFGRDNVHVVPFELLRIDPDAFTAAVLQGAGASLPPSPVVARTNVPSNKGSGAIQLGVQRVANHLTQPSQGPQQPRAWLAGVKIATEVGRHCPSGPLRIAEQRFRGAVERSVGDLFAASNRRLGERIGLDLGALGYCT